MVTAEHEFVIDARADSLLSQISNDFADVILRVAAAQAQEKTEKNVPIVTVCDIEDAARTVCILVETGIKSGQLPPGDYGPVLKYLGQFCDAAARECRQDEHADQPADEADRGQKG